MRSETYTTGSTTGQPPSGRATPCRAVREWRTNAACRGVQGLFFKNDLDSAQQARHWVSRAKAVCLRCPVRPQCAAYALATAEPYGIWGGFTESERAHLLATDWRRYADRRCTWVDVAELSARLRAIRAADERASAELPYLV
jgi:WhiB family redox-sensing transcriptional regulator